MSLSNAQFGGGDSYSSMATTPDIETPLSLGKQTFGSAAQATAWKNRSLNQGRPMSLSNKTMGTTYNFDDGSSPTSLPQSDPGVRR